MLKLEDIKDRDLNSKKILLTSLVMILGITILTGAYIGSQVETNTQEARFSSNATVLNPNSTNGTVKVGVSVGKELSFGRFDARFNKTKTLNLSSRKLTLAQIEARGNISDKLYHKEETLFNGEEQLNVRMSADEYGYYEGEIVLNLETAQNKWGERWLTVKHRYF